VVLVLSLLITYAAEVMLLGLRLHPLPAFFILFTRGRLSHRHEELEFVESSIKELCAFELEEIVLGELCAYPGK
jgi:hypothetical protein